MPTVHRVFSRLRLIKTFWKNYHSNIWMLPKFSNWIYLISISGELIKNLLVRTAAENFEFSGSVPQFSKNMRKDFYIKTFTIISYTYKHLTCKNLRSFKGVKHFQNNFES